MLDPDDTIMLFTRSMVEPLYWLLGYVIVAALVIGIVNRFIRIPRKLLGFIVAGVCLGILYLWLKQFIL